MAYKTKRGGFFGVLGGNFLGPQLLQSGADGGKVELPRPHRTVYVIANAERLLAAVNTLQRLEIRAVTDVPKLLDALKHVLDLLYYFNQPGLDASALRRIYRDPVAIKNIFEYDRKAMTSENQVLNRTYWFYNYLAAQELDAQQLFMRCRNATVLVVNKHLPLLQQFTWLDYALKTLNVDIIYQLMQLGTDVPSTLQSKLREAYQTTYYQVRADARVQAQQ